MTYKVHRIDHTPFSAKIDATRIDGVKLPKRPHGQSRGWRCSGMADCLRQTGYRLLNIDPSDDTYNPDYENAADQGTRLHENFQKHLIAAQMFYDHPEYGPGVELSLDRCCDPALEETRARLGLTGHIDGVVVTKDGSLAIWDLKSVRARDMDARWTADKVQHYCCQVNLYCHFFATHDGRKATQSLVLMASRDNTADRALYQVPYQPERACEELERLEAAHTAVAAGELPVPEPQRGVCKFCSHARLCQKQRREAAERAERDVLTQLDVESMCESA